MIKYIAEKIQNADLVLVGLGEELDILAEVKRNLQSQDTLSRLGNSWIVPYIEKNMLEEIRKERKEFYKLLQVCLQGKNYFIISVCQDGLIREAELDVNRIVEPCGGYRKLQCSKKCCTELYDVPEGLLQQIDRLLTNELTEKDIMEPACPNCGSPLVFNNVNAAAYVEEGYLEQWSMYKRWLQGTVNKNVCILEAGVGMKYPTVIRWPFEKITFFNQKAELFRVHSRLYQISEEIKERSYGICMKPEDFFKELSNAF